MTPAGPPPTMQQSTIWAVVDVPSMLASMCCAAAPDMSQTACLDTQYVGKRPVCGQAAGVSTRVARLQPKMRAVRRSKMTEDGFNIHRIPLPAGSIGWWTSSSGCSSIG
jgi:hypothetical protein